MPWKIPQRYLPVIIGIALGVGIVFLNKSITNRNYRRTKNIVDKNGILSSGTIREVETGSRFKKGRVVFYYFYNDSMYFNRDYKFVNKVHAGKSVPIKIDTTNPARSYIVDTNY